MIELSALRRSIFTEDGNRTCEVYLGGGDRADWIDTATQALILLGLQTAASRSAVESAFRRRALRCHPDRHPKDPLAKARFLRLSRAKELLLSAAEKVFTKSKQPTFTPKDAAQQKRQAQEQAKRERERQRAEERLKQREAEARARKKREEEASNQAEQRRAALRAEEERRERLAAAERQRAEIFEAYRRKRTMQRAEVVPEASKPVEMSCTLAGGSHYVD
ncbi:CAJ1 [Symbiodinium microadriaticum]|nr:CAJ1 [Symbiodinium microadriaticum]